jgi:hypothetical protein
LYIYSIFSKYCTSTRYLVNIAHDSNILWRRKFGLTDMANIALATPSCLLDIFMLCKTTSNVYSPLKYFAFWSYINNHSIFWPFYYGSGYHFLITVSFIGLRWYHTLQGDNSLKSVERFDHMMFVCRFQAFRWSKPQREKLLCGLWMFIALSLLVGICLKFWYLLQWIYSNTLPKN